MNQRLSKIVLLCAVLSTAWGSVAFVAHRSQGACSPGCTTGSDFYVSKDGNVYIRHVFSAQVASNHVNVFQPDPMLFASGSVSATRTIWQCPYVSCSDWRCTPICHTGTQVCETQETQAASNYTNVCLNFTSK